MTTTLLELRNDCKQTADMSGSSFIPDSEWNFYINSSIGDFHDHVVRKDVAFYLTSSQVTVTTGSFALPSDCAVVKGLERSWDGSGAEGTWMDVPPRDFKQRNAGNGWVQALYYPPAYGYVLLSNTIKLLPANLGTGVYQLWYYPTAPKLVNDTDTFDDQRYWYQYVVYDVAIKARQKQGEDVSELMNLKAEQKQKLEDMASTRDFSAPEQVGRGDDWGFGGGWGGGYWP